MLGVFAPQSRVSGGLDPVKLMNAIAQPLAAALDALGEHEVAEIQQDLSVPVVFSIGRGQAHRVIQRSARGEPPRMEEGVLAQHVGHEVVRGGAMELPSLMIFASRPPRDEGDDPDAAVILETELDRPFMRPALHRIEGYVEEFVAGKMKQSI